MTDGALIGARFALVIDLALLMGLPLFWWAMGMAGRKSVLAILALGGMALSSLWLLASTAAMTGTPIGVVLAVRGGALQLALACLFLPQGLRVALIPSAVAAANRHGCGIAGSGRTAVRQAAHLMIRAARHRGAAGFHLHSR